MTYRSVLVIRQSTEVLEQQQLIASHRRSDGEVLFQEHGDGAGVGEAGMVPRKVRDDGCAGVVSAVGEGLSEG